MSEATQTPRRRYEDFEVGAVCRVAGCSASAEYEVYLYDFYRPGFERDAEEFFEQDYTCPFLCGTHMEENERDAVGARQPRGYVRYPFTNRHGAQGYSKYAPVTEAFEQLVLVPHVGSNTVQVYLETNEELLRYLALHPDLLHDVSPRKFEELVAAIFRNRGFSVEITPRTRDGGRDILAIQHTEFGSSLNLVECKRYAQTRRVGVETVRGLYGVVTAENATRGMIVTTSSFTSVALDFASPLSYRLSLHDYDNLKDWLRDFRPG